MPDEPEAHGLLALMLLHDSRRGARFRDGERVPSKIRIGLWNTEQIAAGKAALDRALALHGRGIYVIQAAIAALHTERSRDWPQIAALYGELLRLTNSAVVRLNHAIAVGEAYDPALGLTLIDELQLPDYRYLHSARAELLRRIERTEEARAAYDRALALTDDDTERRMLERRAETLEP